MAPGHKYYWHSNRPNSKCIKGGSTERVWVETVSGAKAAARADLGGESRNSSSSSLQMRDLPPLNTGIAPGRRHSKSWKTRSAAEASTCTVLTSPSSQEGDAIQGSRVQRNTYRYSMKAISAVLKVATLIRSCPDE